MIVAHLGDGGNGGGGSGKAYLLTIGNFKVNYLSRGHCN